MAKYIKTKNYQVRIIADTKMLFPIGEMADKLQGTIVLNDVSLFVLKEFETPKYEKDIMDAILENYDVTADQAEPLILDLIEKFKATGVIEPVE